MIYKYEYKKAVVKYLMGVADYLLNGALSTQLHDESYKEMLDKL